MRKLKMIDNELSEKFKLVLEKELNAITKEMTKNSKTKLSDLIRDNFEDFQLIVKIRRSKNLGGYEYLAYLLSSSGIETSAETLKTLMNRVQKEKNKTKKTQPTQNMMLEPVVKLTEPAPLPSNPLNIDPENFAIALKQNRSYFKELPEENHDRIDLAFIAVTMNCYNYQFLSDRLKENFDLANLYLEKSESVEDLPLIHLSNKKFMLKAVKLYNRNYYKISEDLKSDVQIAKAAIAEHKLDTTLFKDMIKYFENDTDLAMYAVGMNYFNKDALTPELKEKLKDFLAEEHRKRHAY